MYYHNLFILSIITKLTRSTLCIRRAPQEMIPLKPQSGGAVNSDEGIAAGPEQRAQDPLLLQGLVSGGPQRLTQRLQLPVAPSRAPWHHRQHGVDLLHPLLHLLRRSLWFGQCLN